MRLVKIMLVATSLTLGSSLACAQEARRWITTGSGAAAMAQQAFSGRALLQDQQPVFRRFAVTNEIVVAEIAEDALNELAGLIHRDLRRCGGFMAHPSREAALREANNPVYAPGFRPPPGIFPVAIDRQSVVKPALALVDAAEIVKTIKELESFGTRYYKSRQGQEASLLLQRKWDGYGAGRDGFSVKPFPHAWPQESVIATLQGAELADEIVVIGGHLDSINAVDPANAPGADDDASGIAVISEAIRVLIKTGFKPKRTIQFMAYAGEEGGLLGSQEIAKKYKSEGKKVVAMLQLDMTGFFGAEKNLYFVTDFVSADLTTFLKQLIQEYNAADPHKITFGETQCDYGCSDHAAWTAMGYPAAFPFEASFAAHNPHIHTPHDTVANLDATGAHQARFAKLSIEFLVETAKSSGR
ncbi:MAG: M20/M25/M40 family metallo-hydrolase [Hyphomicrobiaceae bacterium]